MNNGGLTNADVLHGYRCALYMAIGLAGLGILLAISFLLKTLRDEKASARQNPAEKKADTLNESDAEQQARA